MARVIVSLLFSLYLAGAALGAAPPPTELVGRAIAWDGDDLVIAGIRIRLHGIDAFELRQVCMRDSEPWPCGSMAWQALQRLVADSDVRCEPAQKRKSRGRPIMTCYVGTLNLNAEMVRQGFAMDCRRFSNGRYAAMEGEARNARHGVWAGTFVTPAASKGKDYCVPRKRVRSQLNIDGN
jgi:endonuclease YncB( thermonuclease family)